jgi:hypothetical protein
VRLEGGRGGVIWGLFRENKMQMKNGKLRYEKCKMENAGVVAGFRIASGTPAFCESMDHSVTLGEL